MIRRRRAVSLAAAATAVVALLIGGGMAGATASATDPGAVISLLDAQRTRLDALPTSVPQEDWDVVPSSSRYLGNDDGRRFWVAQTIDGDVCVIVALGDSGGTVGGACNSLALVEKSGQGVGVQGAEGPTYVAYLLPDSAKLPGRVDGWTVVADNLVVAPADEKAPVVELTLDGGSRIVLNRS